MNELLILFLSLSFSGSILVLILLLCKPFLQSKVSKTWQYYIWLAVIARLLLPFAPEHNLVGNVFRSFDYTVLSQESQAPPEPDFMPRPEADDAAGISPGAGQSEERPGSLISDSPSSDSLLSDSLMPTLRKFLRVLAQNLGLVWLVAAFTLLVRKITLYQSFTKYIKAGCSPIDDIDLLEQFGNAVKEANIHTSVELYTNSLVSSPLLIGFFHPSIVLPDLNCSGLDFEYTMQHELMHYKRKDMFYKWLMQITLCLHWFNPLVHFMARDVNRLCELSCDESIICRLDESSMRDYGDTLLNAVRAEGNYKDSLASVTLNEGKQLLKERLDAIMSYKKQSKKVKALTFALTVTICLTGVYTGAYAAADSQPKEAYKGQDTGNEADVVLSLTSNGQNRITKSGNFEAKSNETLTLTVRSDIEDGSVDLFLFSPDYTEQRITFGGSDETKTITLSAGKWAYNCTGFFKSGDITITGTIPHDSNRANGPGETKAEANKETGDSDAFVLGNGGYKAITQSGSFQAGDHQVLVVTVRSDIRDGSVDLFLFSPDNTEQRMTFSGSDETKTITLSAGTWTYNCTGFFKDGDITIVGKKAADDIKQTP